MQYVFGAYTLDVQRDELRDAAGVVQLDRQVFAVRAYLVQHRAQVVRRQELFEQLWPDRFVSETALERCSTIARRAVGDSGRSQRVIQAVHGRGYRFVAPVEEYLDALPVTALPATPPQDLPDVSPPPLPNVAVSPAASAPPLPASPSPPPTSLPPALQSLPTGERRQVTVLCGTLAHATALADRPGLEMFRHLMQTFHTLAQECVQRDESTLQTLGEEGVLALAAPGTLLASDTTLRLLHSTVGSTAYGLVDMPGYAESLMTYTVKHALTHEVAYNRLLQEQRRALHTRVVEVLEMNKDDRLAEQAERLGHHAVRGEVWGKALTYCRQAGEKEVDAPSPSVVSLWGRHICWPTAWRRRMCWCYAACQSVANQRYSWPQEGGSLAPRALTTSGSATWRTLTSSVVWKSTLGSRYSTPYGRPQALCKPTGRAMPCAHHRIQSATRSAIMIVVALVLERVTLGMIEASTTRNPCIPCTRQY
jgi:DNA-binding winged helix-turn-helix (wHTH) protein